MYRLMSSESIGWLPEAEAIATEIAQAVDGSVKKCTVSGYDVEVGGVPMCFVLDADDREDCWLAALEASSLWHRVDMPPHKPAYARMREGSITYWGDWS